MTGNESVTKAVEVAPDVTTGLTSQEVLVFIKGRDAHPCEGNLVEANKHLPTHKRLLLLHKHGDGQIRVEERIDVVAVF